MNRKKNSKNKDRSLFTTIFATVMGLGILAICLLILPITTVDEGFVFGIGILLVILCAFVAVQGKKGTIAELIYSLSFWK